MRRQLVFSSRVGDRWSFAIEFEGIEGIGHPSRAWNEWWGYLWLWVNGEVVGRPSELEMVMCGFDSLVWSATQAERRSGSTLTPLSPNAALDLVIWSQYADYDVPPPSPFVGERSDLLPYEVLPGQTGPFFDGWQATLIEDGTQERFIFRQNGTQAEEVCWPRGTFKTVVLQARDEFKRLATAGTGGSVCG